jgi:hypothetical protein
MSKVPQKHVQLVRQAQKNATDHELRFAHDGFRVLFPRSPTIEQLDGYIGGLSMVLAITEGGHVSHPALQAIALMLGIGMDEVVRMFEAANKKGG